MFSMFKNLTRSQFSRLPR